MFVFFPIFLEILVFTANLKNNSTSKYNMGEYSSIIYFLTGLSSHNETKNLGR